MLYKVVCNVKLHFELFSHFIEYHTFQLRAYLFQARSLLGSDDTGLSDPFARVLISNQCQSTQVIECSLSPTWDETLVFRNIVLYGPIEEIVDCPPLVIVEVFDYDTVGRCLIKCYIKYIMHLGNYNLILLEFFNHKLGKSLTHIYIYYHV